MTTYTVTITDNGETNTYLEFTPAQLKAARKNYKAVKAVKNEAPKAWYYRGETVILLEDVTNGWSLVCSMDYARQFKAVTAELEYK